ncbi:Clp protease N-terminal domain-containing protein [Labedaea rhizosphaerae]|uniref:ClpA/ClpB-like protein n=1 Tax=Labedaea rhizosphaerae TaxID=598644 RepID=A0A4R6SG94_LABRH|nr:Clp protease N-terminal domain-containing protein [Labedaea rhizosphaerae]TDQ00673.1 ClpA/ClpB-like protein [Labedaea rhizosphaerae]
MRKLGFDDDARMVVRIAQDRARSLQHPGIGSEHLLYGLADSPTRAGSVAREHGLTPGGVAMQTERLLTPSRTMFAGLDAGALATIGIDLNAVREAVEANFGLATAALPALTRRQRARLPGHMLVTSRAR